MVFGSIEKEKKFKDEATVGEALAEIVEENKFGGSGIMSY